MQVNEIGRITKITGAKVLIRVTVPAAINHIGVEGFITIYISIGSLVGTMLVDGRLLVMTVEEIYDSDVDIFVSSSKVGDTLTAIALGGEGEYTYKWTLNGKGAVTTETYEVPADANSGDAIKVVVTDEAGNTAEDTVYVGGFTILKVEPTTASTNNSYKYVRAYFSTSLDSLSTEDIEIRAVKSQQLYSIESVKLSSDGTYADITIAGDASVAETRFLSAGLRYGCTINHDGDVAYLEFELPEFLSDLTVTAVNLDEGKISVVVLDVIMQHGMTLVTSRLAIFMMEILAVS